MTGELARFEHEVPVGQGIASVFYGPHPHGIGGEQLAIHFDNGYVISVIRGFYTFGRAEIAVIHNGELEYREDWEDTVYRTDDPQDLIDLIREIGARSE